MVVGGRGRHPTRLSCTAVGGRSTLGPGMAEHQGDVKAYELYLRPETWTTVAGEAAPSEASSTGQTSVEGRSHGTTMGKGAGWGGGALADPGNYPLNVAIFGPHHFSGYTQALLP